VRANGVFLSGRTPSPRLLASLTERGLNEVIGTPPQGAITQRVQRGVRGLPLQFWLLAAGSFVFLAAMGLAFPYTSLFIRDRLGVSMGVVGLIMGGSAFAGLPLQMAGGHVSDRFGRRPVLATAVIATATMYLGLAFATHLWQVVLLVFCERAFGWPMFLASSNAMVADLVRLRRRPEAYGVLRFSIMSGVVAGPALAGLALAAGASLPQLFAAAGVACYLFLVPLLVFLRETHPERRSEALTDAVAVAAGDHAAADAGTGAAAPPAPAGGYRAVFGDRRFLLFCAVALLPLFCLGQLYTTFPVVATTQLGLPRSAWGLLIAVYAIMVATLQLPLVRLTRRRSAMVKLGVASACFGIGLGGAALAAPGWQLVVLLGVLAVGDVLLSPVSSSVVTEMAPVELRGRYVAVWTLVWMFGLSLGPTLGGLLLDALGGRGLFGLVLAVGLLGAVAFPLLRGRRRSQPALAFRHAKRG
jgi:MFS family permease